MADPVTDTLGQAPDATQIASPELWGTMLRSFGVLLLVLATLILVLWLLRRYFSNQGPGGSQGLIRMLSSLHVAPKERIALVDVLGEKILIGITPQQISFLARIEDDRDLCSTQMKETPNGFFKALLKRNLESSPGDRNTKGDSR